MYEKTNKEEEKIFIRNILVIVYIDRYIEQNFITARNMKTIKEEKEEI